MTEEQQVTESVSLPVEKDWLESLVQKTYNTQATIRDYSCTEISKGKGYVSHVTKVDLTYSNDAEKLPKSLVIKIPTIEKLQEIMDNAPEMLEFLSPEMISRIHSTELLTYEYFEKFQTSLRPIPMAKYLYSEKMTDEKHGMIILEFIEGGSISFNEDYNFEQCSDLLRHVASLHAFCHKNTDFTQVFGTLDECFLGPSVKLLPKSLEKLRTQFPEIFDISDAEIAKIVDKIDGLRHKIQHPEKLGYAPVISFGDSQPNNILFRKNEDGSLGNQVAAFLDFQLLHVGSCAFDISGVIFWGVSSDKFEENVDRFLEVYDSAFVKISGGSRILQPEKLKKEFLQFYPLYLSLFIPGISDMKNYQHIMGFIDERIEELVRKVRKVALCIQ